MTFTRRALEGLKVKIYIESDEGGILLRSAKDATFLGSYTMSRGFEWTRSTARTTIYP